MDQAIHHKLLRAEPNLQRVGVDLLPASERENPGTGLEDARDRVLIGPGAAVEHEKQEDEGFVGAAVAGVGADENVVGLGSRSR